MAESHMARRHDEAGHLLGGTPIVVVAMCAVAAISLLASRLACLVVGRNLHAFAFHY